MNVSQADLRTAGKTAGLTNSQLDSLWAALLGDARASGRPRFDTANVAYYLGALIVIGAMGWFMNRAWDALGGEGLFAVSVVYAGSFLVAGRILWNRSLRVPGGLLLTIAVGMAPLATYGLERWTGYWPAGDPGSYTRFHPYIHGSWIIMEGVTIAAGLTALRFWRFPFLTAPVAYALWYLSMDLAEVLLGHPYFNWNERAFVTMAFGAVMLAATYAVDLLGKPEDFTFWGYLFGLASFWGGLSSMESNSELSKFIYCLVNLALILASVALRRKAFIVFGSLGFFGYLSHLAYRVFQDSFLFPVVLSLVGVAVIYLGLQYQKRREAIEEYLRREVFPHIRSFIPARVLAE